MARSIGSLTNRLRTAAARVAATALTAALTAAFVTPLVAVDAPAAAARGTVVGRITMLEREGERTADLEDGVVWLERVDGDAPGPAPSTPDIVMESRHFRPAVRVVAPGSAVAFPNYDPFRHNVFSNAGPGAFDLGLYGRGEVRTARIERPGIYPIFCNIHSRMVAYVVAVPSPWRAQAGPDGRYEIAGVPPGRYRLHAWHDRAAEQARDVDVPAGGPARVDVELDARGWRYVPHKNKFGQDYPPEDRDRY